MARKQALRQTDRFFMNNCKIANELRKYRDLAGCLNQVSVSGERSRRPASCADYAEYYISENLSYLDMVTANAAYTLMVSAPPQAEFQADAVAQIMSGNPGWRILGKRRSQLEARLQRLAGIQLHILADHDHQVEQDLYEGAFLPVSWVTEGDRTRFRFLPDRQMPLYQYAEDHKQILEVPAARLRDSQEAGQVRHNNNDRMLLLRHCLLQELEILRYGKNKVTQTQLRLLKRDRDGEEFGLHWTLGILDEAKENDWGAVAKKVHASIRQLLTGWQESGWLGPVTFQMLSPREGYGVHLFTPQAGGT